MWARVARFEGHPADVEVRIERLRATLAGGLPPELADAKLLVLVDREGGGMVAVTLFDSEEAMRRGDEAMNGGPGNAGSRASVDFYEVPIHTLSGPPPPRAAERSRSLGPLPVPARAAPRVAAAPPGTVGRANRTVRRVAEPAAVDLRPLAWAEARSAPAEQPRCPSARAVARIGPRAIRCDRCASSSPSPRPS